MTKESEIYKTISSLIELKEEYEKEIKDVERTGNDCTYIKVKHDLFHKQIRLDCELYVMILKSNISDIDKAIESKKRELYN